MPNTATFEAGVNGATITTGDPGSLSPWDAVTIGAGGAITYDNAHAYGALSGKVVRSGNNCALKWNTSLGVMVDHYGRFYFYPQAIVNANDFFVANIIAGGATGWYMVTDTPGHVTLFDATFTQRASSTVTLTAGQWVRIEYHAVQNVVTGSVDVRIFLSPDSDVPNDTVSMSGVNIGASCTEVMYSGGAQDNTFWFDNIIANAPSYPGPVVLQSQVMLPMGMLGTGRV